MKLYRPSNGTEGAYFMQEWCERCTKMGTDDDMAEGCRILADSYCYEIEDEKYPRQWVQQENGQGSCTAFCLEVPR